MSISTLVSKVIGDKRRWRAYKARVRQLPESYRIAVEAIEKYLMLFVPTSSNNAASMFEDLADLFEQAAADRTPVGAIVGSDPVAFVDTFAQNYTDGGYVPARARNQLTTAIERASGSDS